MFIIGADIGRSTSLGVIELDDDLNIVDVDVNFFFMHDVGGSNVYKKSVLYDFVSEIVHEVRPVAFAIEAPFMSRFPKAFGLLSEFMSTIELAIHNTEPNVIQYRVSPREGKTIVGAKSDDKEDMYNAVMDIPELRPFIRRDMNEHEIDSIAIAYWVVQRYREEPAMYIVDRYK